MVGIDTNILLYAYDRGSSLYDEAKALIRSLLGKNGIAISDLSLLEFFSVITDGKKMSAPLIEEEALRVIESIWSAEEFRVCSGNTEVMRKAVRCAAEFKMSRYGINDVYIAISLAEKGFRRILTRNTKDFKKFDFIEAVNPFSSAAMRSAPSAKCFIPYGRQSIDEQDVAAVCSVLHSDWLTTGPKVAEFEETFAQYVGAKHAVAVSSGTAALHTAMYAIGIKFGDEVIVPPITFAATANCIVFQGGTPVFADVTRDTLLIDPAQVEAKITPRTKAVIAVDYAGQPCDYDSLKNIAGRNNLILVADACHALGAEYKGQKAGSLADLTVFSFHPVKHITTGEGGMITTNDPELANRMRLFRNHGITRDPEYFSPLTSDFRPPSSAFPWFYEMIDLGYNYRITDIQCALGISQLQKLPKFLERRREIAARYDEALADIPRIEPLGLRADVQTASQNAKRMAQSEDRPSPSSSDPLLPADRLRSFAPRSTLHAPRSSHAYHLYVIRIDSSVPGIDRTTLFTNLREKGIGVNVHYIPVHLQPFYRERFHTDPDLCPVAETAYKQIISIPMFPKMTDEDVERVIIAVTETINK